jgi:hypothetical protein
VACSYMELSSTLLSVTKNAYSSPMASSITLLSSSPPTPTPAPAPALLPPLPLLSLSSSLLCPRSSFQSTPPLSLSFSLNVSSPPLLLPSTLERMNLSE